MKFLDFDNTRDFPFYNENPKMSKIGWFVLLLCIPIGMVFYELSSLIFESDIVASFIFCLVLLIPLLYFSKWNYKLMFRKPTRNEIILALLMFIGYLIYSLLVTNGLDALGLLGVGNTPENAGINIDSTIGLIFSMMGEELVKFIPLMFLMRVVYKYSNNRKLAIIVSTVLVMIGFGLLHYYPPYSTLASVLTLQGIGSIFEMYGYLKTKNIFVPYITHLLTDVLFFVLILLGMG